MAINGVNSNNEVKAYEKPEEISLDVSKNKEELAQVLAGIKASVDRAVSAAQSETGDGGVNITKNEAANLKNWQDRIQRFYNLAESKARRVGNEVIKEALPKIEAFINKIKNTINPQSSLEPDSVDSEDGDFYNTQAEIESRLGFNNELYQKNQSLSEEEVEARLKAGVDPTKRAEQFYKRNPQYLKIMTDHTNDPRRKDIDIAKGKDVKYGD